MEVLNDLYDIKNLKKEINEIKNHIIKEEIKPYSQNIYEYDFIFSIGSACQCATMLKKANLRKYSGPFDWVSGGSIYNRLYIVENEFDNFFIKNDLILKKYKNNKNVDIIFYKNKRTYLEHIHDFNMSNNFNIEYTDVYYKYMRRINRVQEYLKSNKVLMIYMIHPFYEKGLLNTNRIIESVQNIRKKYNNKNIDLLITRHYNFKRNVITHNKIGECLDIYTLSYNLDNNIYKPVNTIQTLQILKQYKIKEH